MASKLTETQRKVQAFKRRLAPIDYVNGVIAAPFAIWLVVAIHALAF